MCAGPLSRERARDLIRKHDRDTSGYMRYMFNIDWLEPHHWDMVVNTGRFSVDEVVEMVTAIVGSGMLEPSVLDRQRLGNLALASRVEATVLGDPSVWVRYVMNEWSCNSMTDLLSTVASDAALPMPELPRRCRSRTGIGSSMPSLMIAVTISITSSDAGAAALMTMSQWCGSSQSIEHVAHVPAGSRSRSRITSLS